MHTLIKSRSQQLLKIDIMLNMLEVIILNPASLLSLQLFPVSLTGRRSGLEGKADLLGLTTQRGRTHCVQIHTTRHILVCTECM